MKIKIKGATPQNIAETIQDILEQFELNMWDANIYINFTKDGVPMVSVNNQYEEVSLLRELDPNAETPKMKLANTQFVSKAQLKSYTEQKELERLQAYKKAEIIRNTGYLYIAEKESNYKLFYTKHNPTGNEFKTLIKKKEKEGYTIPLIIRRQYVHHFIDELKKKFKEEGKELVKGSFPLFALDLNDIEYIKSQANEIIKEV